ncbi:hypothetical protein BD626DRAFT_575714 [Schizophyllum amplum]|uniref:Uncharacterized protein n=1 Tax=Schizophyllum amplum TaxID=97359 RepID=A0A550BV17_9AGAR|nr:hypothetical protein BD626DRAFT_575714 [Auriculariopsis ampla]
MNMEHSEEAVSGRRTRSIEGAEAPTRMLAGDEDVLTQPEGNLLADGETPDEAGCTNFTATTDFARVPWITTRRTPVPTHSPHGDNIMNDSVDGNDIDNEKDELDEAGEVGDLGVQVEVEIDEEEEVQIQVQVQVEDDDDIELRERARRADEEDMDLVERELGAMDAVRMFEDDSHRVPRTGVTVIDRWSFFRMLFAVHRNLSATFPELVMWGQVFLRCDYRICIYNRAVEDSLRWVIWNPDAPIPWDFYALSGAEWLTFVHAHSLPAYLQGWRMTRATLGNRVPGETGIMTGPRSIMAGPIVVDSVSNLTLRELAWTTNGTIVVPEAGRMYSFDDLYPRAGQPHLVDFNAARATAHESASRAPPSTPTRMNSPARRSGSPISSTAVAPSEGSRTSTSDVDNWKVGQRLRQPDGTWGPIIRSRRRRRQTTRTPSPTSSAMRESYNMEGEYDSDGLYDRQSDSDERSVESEQSVSSSSSESLEYASSEDNAPPSAQQHMVLTSSDDDALNGPRGMSPMELTDDESSIIPTVSRAASRARSVIDLTADTPGRVRLMSPIVMADTPARGRTRRRGTSTITDDEGPPSNRRRMSTIELSSDEEGARTRRTRAYISSDEEGQQSPPQWGDPPLDGASQQSADSDSDGNGEEIGCSKESGSPEV